MRERFRHAHGEGSDLVIHELLGPCGSVWALVEDGPGAAGRARVYTLLWEGAAANVVVGECARRLAARYGGQPAVWEALVRESLEPSF